jgi:hypothetical protein
MVVLAAAVQGFGAGIRLFFTFSYRVLVAKWQEQDCIFFFSPVMILV